MSKKDTKEYVNFSNVRSIRNELTPEEFPEGPLGSPINSDKPVYSKSTEWKEGQYRQSAYVYSNKELHDDLPRQAPGAHPLHDEQGSVSPQEER